MDYEKKYKEALERARKIENKEPVDVPDGTSIPVAIFPELKESEDERIRKELIRAFKSFNSIKVWNGIERTNILAWLEKQGNNADKVEPKFKIGDWIITPENKVLQITNIEGTNYVFNNKSHYWEIYYCDKQCRLWTIEDAKELIKL